MKRTTLGTTGKLTVRIKDREIPVKSDSDDSDDEYDANWNLVTMSKETFRKRQAAIVKGELDADKDTNEPTASPKAQTSAPSVIRVTNYVPVINKAANRENSIRTLEATRAMISERSGRPSRLVIDPASGMLLARDTVDTRLYDERKEESTSFHYSSSVQAMERLRDLRLLHKLESLDD